MTKNQDLEKIDQLMTDLEFEEHELGDDENHTWRELKFEFGGGKFEIVVDAIPGNKKMIFVQLGGSCSEEINRLPLTYTNLLKVLQTWGLI